MNIRVLVIDDDVRLFEVLRDFFEQNAVQAQQAIDGPRGLAALERDTYDAVLLDVMMPGMDGLQVLKRIRQNNTVPVIMLTARGEEADRVVGLELGADDYVPKPFSPRELLARIRAVLRRGAANSVDEQLRVGDITVDTAARVAQVSDEVLDLTGLEFDLLVALARQPGRVVPRQELLEEAGRGDVFVSERTVDVHISHLRKKLGDDARSPQIIKTVRGVGYVLVRDMP